MKIFLAVLLSVIICFSNTSCQKEFELTDVDSSMITPPGGGVNGSFTAKIDGVPFVADKVAGASRALGLISIAGMSNKGEQIVFTVVDSGVHVYTLPFDASFMNAGAYSKDSGIAFTSHAGTTPDEAGGTLSITSIDTVKKTMSGTFSMKVFRPLDKQKKNITQGVFTNIPYTTEALPPSNSLDTFRVKVDGVAFKAYSITGVSLMSKITVQSSSQDLSKTVGLMLPSTVKPGDYDLSAFGDYMGQYNSGTNYMTGDGKLTILEHNTTTKRIRGNFSFHGAELMGTVKAELTEGYFSVVYK